MSDKSKRDQNTGQQKQHTVRDADGNETVMTQAEWRQRDKSAGLERVDGAEEAPVEEVPTEETEG